MGNKNSKPAEQVPEGENAAPLRAYVAGIAKLNEEWEDRDAAAKMRRAREDAEWAAAKEKSRLQQQKDDEKRGQALAQQEKLVQKQKARAVAAAVKPVTTVNNKDEAAVATPTASDPSTPVDIQDTLAGWNPRKEPRPKSSSGVGQDNQAQRITSASLDAQLVGGSRKQTPPIQRATSQANSGATEKQDSNHILPPKPDVIRPSSTVASAAAKPGNTTVLPTVVGKNVLPAKPATAAKRAEPVSGFEQSGRRDLSSLSFQKRPRASVDLSSASTSPRSPVTPSDQAERKPPEWYLKMSVVKKRDSNTGNADALLDRLKDQIATLKKLGPLAIYGNAERIKHMNELRETLHEAPFLAMGTAGPQLVRNKRILHNNDGLPQLFDDRYAGSMAGEWPWDVKSDAAELYSKWCSENFNSDMLFGLILSQKTGNPENDRKGDTVDKRYQVSSKYQGNGDLVNGQWWPTLLCALRDGAHGDSQAGISGDTRVGAYSCFMSGGKHHIYPDRDEGSIVYYYGTDTTTPGQLSRGTALLKKNKDDRIPVRFIRSSKANSKYAPPVGFRYDGLYDVTSYELVDRQKERYCFKLVRQDGQGPIRGGSGPEARPTRQEQERFQQDKRFRGFGSKE